MNIIVFGATGGVGQQFTQQALEHGDSVTAFVRTPNKLTITHDNLHVIQGDAHDYPSVEKAIADHDAVVSCLGSSAGMKKSTELADMTKNIVDAMKATNVSKILYTASAGIDREIPGVAGKSVMWLLRNPLADHRVAVNYIKENGLTYTIARPLGLKNAPLTGTYHESKEGVPGTSSQITRANVAHFLLKALHDPTYENTSVGLSD